MNGVKKIGMVLFFLYAAFFAAAQDKPVKPKLYTHTPDVTSFIPKVKTKVPGRFGYDSAYMAYISKPDEYFSDFFGIQLLQRTTREMIEKDFVPAYASISRSDSNRLELQFKEGYTAAFYIQTNLAAFGLTIENDHVWFNDSTWQLFTAHLAKFRLLLKKLNLEKKYLVPNPYYKQELQTFSRIQNNPAPVQVTIDSTGELFKASAGSLFIFPDKNHGDSIHFMKLYEFLKTADYDWFGAEMLSVGWQKDIDVFLTASPESAEFKAAKQRLVDFYTKGWKIRGKFNTDEDLPWIKLYTMLRERKKKVYALESDDIRYILFRFGETNFGAMVRNTLWAERVPASGKGIVFGGSSHYTLPPPANFQDFVFEKNKKRKLYSLFDVNTKH